ncbi:hypothetical protein [Herbidospora mongoliensis]|uniref:hypothetical protein n=1 Tax=Herbidospora mongoliensis TaxID=688067 RepID=UPI00082FE6B1|nr:hypothetical protein [Herbidospora mongoliensis]
MNGIVLNRADRSAVAGAIVGAWRSDREELIGIDSTGADGRFDLDLPVGRGDRGDVVLRTFWGRGADDRDPRALVSVIQIPVPGRLIPLGQTVIWLDRVDRGHRPAFGRALIDGDPVREGLTVVATDPAGGRQKAAIGRGGRFTVIVDENGTDLRLWLSGGDRVADWPVSPERPESDVEFTGAATCRAAGRVSRKADDAPLPRLRVELLDRAGRWVNPVGAATTTETGEFALTFPHLVDQLPDPTFAVWSHDERIAVVDWAGAWTGPVLNGVRLVVDVAPDRPVTYRLDVQALDRATRQPVPGLRAEVWDAAFATMVK